MWLDRLSGHSTPAATPSGSPPPPANRAFSPAPRRPSHLAPSSAAQRPGFSARSSSLSINSNDSTTSLLASSRKTNGSGLKQSITTPDVKDPLEVLEKLLGSEANVTPAASRAKNSVNGTAIEEEDDESELDFEGFSLRELASRHVGPEETVGHTTQTTEECTLMVSYIAYMKSNPS
jgi:hypothetical protein